MLDLCMQPIDLNLLRVKKFDKVARIEQDMKYFGAKPCFRNRRKLREFLSRTRHVYTPINNLKSDV